MAQYTISRTCGHSETIQIYGTDRHGRRDWIAKQEAAKPCTDCAQATREAERQVASEKAAEQAREQALPELTGTPKQVAWAETIRAETVAKLDTLRLEIGRRLGAHPERVALADMQGEALTNVVLGKTEARWWIDHRGVAAYTTIRSEAAALVRQWEETR